MAIYQPAYADELSLVAALARLTFGAPAGPASARIGPVLAMGWSPEQVAGRLACEQGKPVISHESIYRFIYAQIRRTNDFHWRLYLPRGKFQTGLQRAQGRRFTPCISSTVSPLKNARQVLITAARSVHWETDLVMFSNKKDNLLVAQERVSRFIFIALQTDKKAERVARNLENWFTPLPPAMRRTLTQDNGTEFAESSPPQQ